MNYHGQQTRPFPFWNLVSEKNKVEKHVFSRVLHYFGFMEQDRDAAMEI